MIVISDLPVSVETDTLEQALIRLLGSAPKRTVILKRSVDARRKSDLKWIYTVVVDASDSRFPTWEEEPSYQMPLSSLQNRPVIAGFGPAGMFAALALARSGARPIVAERGKCVEERKRDVSAFWAGGAFSEQSNVAFGEGGAGTFSDGKLTTGTKSPFARTILRDMVQFGAPEEILWQNKPHIGTDRLQGMVAALRAEVIRLGGEVLFEHRLDRIETENGRLCAVGLDYRGERKTIACDRLVLALGHSARDTFRMLYERGIGLCKKPFAVGVRAEHLQSEIDRAQFGKSVPQFGAADYKLVSHPKGAAGVYTFCMCPGGEVVAAGSEQGGVVTNGMSRFARDGKNANSALLVGVDPPGDVFAGVELQRRMERAAFSLGGGDYRAPAQLMGDFLSGRTGTQFGQVLPTYRPGVTLCSLEECLPAEVSEALRLGIRDMARKLNGFDAYDAVLTGVETRSSSPIRILRDDTLQSVSCRGIYPCGEGAGYAGGIMSAAADGMRVAERILTEKD